MSSKPRKTGSPGHAEFASIKLSTTLDRIADAVIADDVTRNLAERKACQQRTAGYKVLLTDAEVLEARALMEFGGATSTVVAERYGVTNAYVSRLKLYLTRSKLIPDRSHLPVGWSAEP